MEAVTFLDEQDRIIVRMLQENARVSYQELADATGTSPSTARRRVDRLLETKTLKLVAVPNWQKLGVFFIAFMGIKAEPQHLRNICQELARMDEILFVAIATGQFDIVAEVVLPQNQDMVRFVTQRIAPITGIRDIQTSMIPEFIKSSEQYRLPLSPNPLYMRTDNGTYAFSEDLTDVSPVPAHAMSYAFRDADANEAACDGDARASDFSDGHGHREEQG